MFCCMCFYSKHNFKKILFLVKSNLINYNSMKAQSFMTIALKPETL